jgi:hypothetical protein
MKNALILEHRSLNQLPALLVFRVVEKQELPLTVRYEIRIAQSARRLHHDLRILTEKTPGCRIDPACQYEMLCGPAHRATGVGKNHRRPDDDKVFSIPRDLKPADIAVELALPRSFTAIFNPYDAGLRT